MPVVNVIEMELLFQQAYVLVDLNVSPQRFRKDINVLLANRFDESHFGKTLLEAGHEGKGGGGFSDMLFCGGDEDWALAFGVGGTERGGLWMVIRVWNRHKGERSG